VCHAATKAPGKTEVKHEAKPSSAMLSVSPGHSFFQNEETHMTTNRTYVKTEVVGSSDKSVSDAIESAIATASRSLRNLDWFEVIEVRGNIRDSKVLNYQVTLKLGLRYEPKA
jgi:flavin-binding protein dodecin